jgi:hypothetical protein
MVLSDDTTFLNILLIEPPFKNRQLIAMSPSRRDALDRVRHFEQLANGRTFPSSLFEEEKGTMISTRDIVLDERNIKNETLMILSSSKRTLLLLGDGVSSTCPFDADDVDFVASISFNYGLSLMDMNQVMIYTFQYFFMITIDKTARLVS